MALDLCISDLNKPRLLANPDFIQYLISGLFLGADHPRADVKDDVKRWNQTMHAECFAQLVLFPPGRDALRADPGVDAALQTVAKEGLSAESREFAKAALMAMSDDELQMRSEGQKHVMLSYQWGVQATIQRLDESLKRRGYLTWFDLTNMKGELIPPLSARCVLSTRRNAQPVLACADRKHDGRDERCDRGSRRDAVRCEPAVQGVCECACCGARHCRLSQ